MWLHRLGIPFELRDIYGTEGTVAQLVEQRVTKVPAFQIGDTIIEGFDRAAVLAAFYK